MHLRRISIRKLILAIAIPFGAGAIGSIATSSSIPTWYTTLEKPFFNPPNWVFGPVWTLLYALQAVAFYIILTRRHPSQQLAIAVFVMQSIGNLGWSLIFFGLRAPLAALIEIIILWGLILTTIMIFKQLSPKASGLLWPYLAWVSFAAILNAAIVILN